MPTFEVKAWITVKAANEQEAEVKAAEKRISELEAELHKKRILIGLKQREITDLRSSPWRYLPWRGYVS